MQAVTDQAKLSYCFQSTLNHISSLHFLFRQLLFWNQTKTHEFYGFRMAFCGHLYG